MTIVILFSMHIKHLILNILGIVYFEVISESLDVDLVLFVYLAIEHQKDIFDNAYLIFIYIKYEISLFLICLIGFNLVSNCNKTHHILRSAI